MVEVLRSSRQASEHQTYNTVGRCVSVIGRLQTARWPETGCRLHSMYLGFSV